MRAVLLAVLVAVVPPGHHYGWRHGHGNPHRQAPCAVFHVGCPSINPPPSGPAPTPVPLP